LSALDRTPPPAACARFTLAFLAFVALPPFLLAAFVALVDPYYVVGAPSRRGINVVRPFYEPHVLEAKPYQVARIRPDAVSLGSSIVEVGLDPRHPGWGQRNVFDFGLPSATSYEIMLAFLHARAVGPPLKQAVVGLDFFAFNIFFARNELEEEVRFAGDGAEAFADYLGAELARRPHGVSSRQHRPALPAADAADALPWNEPLYLIVHPDVRAAIARGTFKSGREHYRLAGRAEGREGGTIPSGWNEALYLRMYPDVAAEVKRGTFVSGYHHYLAAGRAEGRESGIAPDDWDEVLYLRVNPDVQREIMRGTFVSGYHHYLAAGRAERREGGVVPGNWNEALYRRINPDVQREVERDTFLSGYHHYLAAGRAEGRASAVTPDNWDEALYLRIHPDVRAEVNRGTFLSGYHHYLAAGRAEGRIGGMVPLDWDEATYLQVNRDVEYQITQHLFLNGYHHYLVAGQAEKRLGGHRPAGWNEEKYLAANPAARNRLALGDYRSGYAHYAAVGRRQGLQGGFAPAGLRDRVRARWAALGKLMFRADERFRLILSATAVSDAAATIGRQSEAPVFDDRGMRVWSGHDEALRQIGGTGPLLRGSLLSWRWYLWLRPPRFQYCFTNTETGMTMFDPYRFMLRQAYADGTDVRLYVSPMNTAVRELIDALGLGERYEFWLRELVRINEEEAARAERKPLPLWDFSDPNDITTETIPLDTNPAPMRWFWDASHIRKAAGDLILDRVLGYHSPERTVPADFGTLLTEANIKAHLASSQARRAQWAAANTELASKIAAAVRNPKAENRQAQAACW
jgi:hypothetical protein